MKRLKLLILVAPMILACYGCLIAQEQPCKSYYNKEEGGRCKQRYMEDNNGQIHGKYISYDENGVVAERGSYVHGKRQGSWYTQGDYMLQDYLQSKMYYEWFEKGELIIWSRKEISSYAEALKLKSEFAAKVKEQTLSEEKQRKDQLMNSNPCKFIEDYPYDDRSAEAREKCDQLKSVQSKQLAEKRERQLKEQELKQKDDEKFNEVLVNGTIEEYLRDYPNGIHSKELEQFQHDYLKKLEQVEVGFGRENPNQFLGYYNSGFNSVPAKSKLIRDITFRYILNRFNGNENIAGLIQTYNIAESENCSKELLNRFPRWVKPLSTSLNLTISGKYAESNDVLQSISDESTLKEFALVDFCTGVNHLLLGEKSASKQALKKVYSTADDGNGKYNTIIYEKAQPLIDLLVSNGMDKTILMKALNNTSRPEGSKFWVNESGKIVWYN